jgi:hypothetical protein
MGAILRELRALRGSVFFRATIPEMDLPQAIETGRDPVKPRASTAPVRGSGIIALLASRRITHSIGEEA